MLLRVAKRCRLLTSSTCGSIALMRLTVLALTLGLASCSGSQPDAPGQSARARQAAPQKTAPLELQRREYRTHIHEPSPPDEAAKNRSECDKGNRVACHAAALDQYYSPPGPDTDRRAFEYFEKACNAGYAPSCNGLGVLYATGRGVAQDEVEAARIYRKACLDGATTACTHLEQALRYGRGVAKDLVAAAAAAARANCVFEASLKHGELEDCPLLDAQDGGAD